MKRLLIHFAALLAGSAWLSAQQASGSQGADDPQNLLNIQFQEDLRVFTVMAAINAAGFDYEKDGKSMSDVRQAVREKLEQKLDESMKARLAASFEQHAQVAAPRDRHVVYTSLALILSGPPDFQLNMKEADMPGDTWRVRSFQSLLADFFRMGEIDKLWERYKSRYTVELAGYVPVLRESIRRTLEYFRIPVRVMVDRRIILIPDLLNAHDIVNARNLERTYYVVVGPTEDPSNNVVQLRHEYLHTLVDPLMARQSELLEEHRGLFELAEAQPQMREVIQQRYELMVIESLIEAIQLRMNPLSEEDMKVRTVRLFREGLVLFPFFYRSLAEYEKNELLALPSFLDLILQNIDEKAVEEDRRAVVRMEAAMEEERTAAEAELAAKNEEVRAHNRRVRLLQEAGRMIAENRLQEAEETLETLLAEYPGEPGGLFYMAQVKSKGGLHEEAYQWYLKTAESQAEAWIKASSLVRMGRIDAAGGRFDQARQRFQEVLQLEGDLRGASDEARDLLSKLPPAQ